MNMKRTFQEFRTKEPRRKVTLTVRCFAVDDMFTPKFTDMPESLQRAFDDGLTIPCEGGGVPGEWCRECVFGEMEEE